MASTTPYPTMNQLMERGTFSGDEMTNFRRAQELAFEVSIRPSDPNAWLRRIPEHLPEFADTMASSPTAHSCQHCQKMIIDVSNPLVRAMGGTMVEPKRLVFPCSLADVRFGATDGCDLFTLILEQLEAPSPAEENEGDYRVCAWGRMRSSDCEFDLDVVTGIGVIDLPRPWTKWNNRNANDTKAHLAYLNVHADQDDLAANFVTNRPLSLNPFAPITVRKIGSWLDECVHGHSADNETGPIDLEQLPSRLIHISKQGSDWSLKLQYAQALPFRYCTLSYCWGFESKGLTTIENIDGRHTSLDYHALPRTIQDAVAAAHVLKFDYIWVDAICIIQDDPSDQAKEISKMSSIFANSTVTLCASRSLFADEGFLHQRTPYVKAAVMFKLPFKLPSTGKIGSVTLSQLSGYCQDNRLEERAWGFQERIMSNRIIDFDGTATSFSCCHGPFDNTQRDGGPFGHAQDWGQLDRWRSLLFNLEADIQKGDLTSSYLATQSSFPFQWYDIVRDYTERSVSVSTDRILAIASVAERFFKIAPDEYCAGFGVRTFPWSLMWSMRDRDVRLPRPRKSEIEYQGPSWSWLSVNGPVHFYYAREMRENAKVDFGFLGSEVDLSYEHAPYGSLRSASLVVKGRIRRARWIRSDKVKRGGDYDYLALHPQDVGAWRSGVDFYASDDDDPTANGAQQFLPARILPDALEPEFALPIQEGGLGSLNIILLLCFFHDRGPSGIVLRDPGEDNDGMYERVGIFVSYKEHSERYATDESDHDLYPTDQQNDDRAKTDPEDQNEDMQGMNDMEAWRKEVLETAALINNEIMTHREKELHDARIEHAWTLWKYWFSESDCQVEIMVMV